MRYEAHKNAGTVDYPKWVLEKGILVPVFDIDGTLTAHLDRKLDENVFKGLESQNFASLFPNIAIVSNNYDREHVKYIADSVKDRLGTYVLSVCIGDGYAKKPNKQMGLVVADHFGIMPENLGIIGDRRISDVMFARNLGAGAMALCMRVGEFDGRSMRAVRWAENKIIAYDKRMGFVEDYV